MTSVPGVPDPEVAAPGWMGASALELLFGIAPPGFKEGYEELQIVTGNIALRSQLVQRWTSKVTRHLARRELRRTETPEDALSEREVMASHMIFEPKDYNEILIPEEFRPHLKTGFTQEPDLFWRHRAKLAGLSIVLSAAEVFLWRSEIVMGAQAMTLPDHVVGAEGFALPFQWWTFELPVCFEGTDLRIESLLLIRFVERVGIVYQFSPCERTHEKVHWEMHQLRFGERVGATHSHAWILKMVAFLNSKYVSTDPMRMPRGMRRALARAGEKKNAETGVRVVDLRSKASTAGVSTGHEPEAGARDWAGRWWVRGHIRAQWYPSTQSHKVIWVAPHLKGPEDKPILGRVYRVSR